MKRIAIFVSGEGTNAENIIRYFQSKKTAEVIAVISNRKNAPALERAARLGVAAAYFNNETFEKGTEVLDYLISNKADFIVLAGFLRLIPQNILKRFEGKIINIHPALLPKYGGHGMYGMRVHEAVIANKEKETGITIHFVNERYDEGKIIFQKKVEVDDDDSPQSISKKVHALEMEFFPKVVEDVVCA